MELKLQHVSVAIDQKKIVDDISLKVGQGDFVGMIGPNGSGKSTLLRAVYRVLKPSGGAIFLDDVNLYDMKPVDFAKQVAVVGQFNAVEFDFTVWEMVLMGRNPHKKLLEAVQREDRQIVLEALAKVGMEQELHHLFSTLSGGEKQRVILARALAQQPKILILDEPTNHLDIKYQLQILSIVKSLGIGVLAVLHDLSLAAMYCNQLYIMKNGKVVRSGKPREIITSELVRSVYEIDCEIAENPLTGCLAISYYSGC